MSKKAPAPRSVRATLLAARDRMNHGGKRWIKGQLSRKFGKAEATKRGIEEGEFGFCSLGGIVAVTANRKYREGARLALATEIVRTSPRICESMYAVNADGKLIRRGIGDAARREDVDRIVFTYNDNPRRKWDEIDGVFTRAAESVKR